MGITTNTEIQNDEVALEEQSSIAQYRAKQVQDFDPEMLQEQLDDMEENQSNIEAFLVEDRVGQFFKFNHLPKGLLRDTSKSFACMARMIMETVPSNAERTVALRKLLEAKDAAVRACLPSKF